jgi:hypothetical protein
MIGSLLIVALTAGIDSAQGAVNQAEKAAPDSRPKSAAAAGRAAGELSPGEVVGMADAHALVQAQDALQLNDSQYGTFVGRLKKLQETRRKNQQTRNQIVQELRRLAGPQAATPVDEAGIRDQLKALHDLTSVRPQTCAGL